MAKMIGKQPGLYVCCYYCRHHYRSRTNRKKFVRHLKHRERQALKKEITDQQA